MASPGTSPVCHTLSITKAELHSKSCAASPVLISESLCQSMWNVPPFWESSRLWKKGIISVSFWQRENYGHCEHLIDVKFIQALLSTDWGQMKWLLCDTFVRGSLKFLKKKKKTQKKYKASANLTNVFLFSSSHELIVITNEIWERWGYNCNDYEDRDWNYLDTCLDIFPSPLHPLQ